MPAYSILAPFHNEQENCTQLYERLKTVMEATGKSFELVFVDDGSSDRTFELLREIAAVDSRVVVVKLRRNFGQTSALAAGFDHASGDFFISMDGDLQHDPAEIPRFMEKLEEGYDLVSGWRTQRADNLWMRRIPSRCANWMMAKLSGLPLHDFGTTFKGYRQEVIRKVALYGDLHRFIPALASWQGITMCEVPISNPPRTSGASHYGISRTIRVFLDLITIRFLLRHLSRPMHFFGRIGLLGMLAGTAIGLWLIVEKLLWHISVMEKHGPLMILAVLLVLAGIQVLSLGLLGEMHVRHFHEPESRASYSVERVLRAKTELSSKLGS